MGYGMAYLKKVPSQPHNPKLFKKRKGSDFYKPKVKFSLGRSKAVEARFYNSTHNFFSLLSNT